MKQMSRLEQSAVAWAAEERLRKWRDTPPQTTDRPVYLISGHSFEFAKSIATLIGVPNGWWMYVPLDDVLLFPLRDNHLLAIRTRLKGGDVLYTKTIGLFSDDELRYLGKL